MGKMIDVMEEEMGPHVLSAVETGRNILNIIGAGPQPPRNSLVLTGNLTEWVNIMLSVSR